VVEVATPLRHAVELLAVLVTGYFTVVMWKRRSAPTARPLLVFAALLFVGNIGHALLVYAAPVDGVLPELRPPTPDAPLWLGFLSVVILLSGGFWFLFTLQYTGRSGRLIPLAAGGVVLYWIGIVVAAVFGDFTPDATIAAEGNAGLVVFIGAYMMCVVMVVGSVLVLTTTLRRNAVRAGEAVALAGCGLLVAFSLVGSNTLQAATTVPILFSLAAGAVSVAVKRYPAFEAPPVARIAGRDRLIEEIDDPFVVVDATGQVRDLNPAAEGYFDAESEVARGQSLDTLLPGAIDPERVANSREPVFLRTGSGATLACYANRITDARERSFGHLLVFRDVTERQRRERRLSVLNQLLTGAVSERMSGVADTVAPVAEADDGGDIPEGPDTAAIGSDVQSETTRLLDLVAWTREIERSFATAGSDSVVVTAPVRAAVETVADDSTPDVTVTADGTDPVVTVDRHLLETVFEMLLTDALERDADAVRVASEAAGEGVTVTIVATSRTSGGAPTGEEGVPGEPARTEGGLLIETARQAIQHYGGAVSVETVDGERRTIVELPDPESERGDDGPLPVVDPIERPTAGDREGTER